MNARFQRPGLDKEANHSVTGAEMIVVPCHSCHGQLESIKQHYDMAGLEVKYLWELVADTLVLKQG